MIMNGSVLHGIAKGVYISYVHGLLCKASF